jgi:hypothetical protein
MITFGKRASFIAAVVLAVPVPAHADGPEIAPPQIKQLGANDPAVKEKGLTVDNDGKPAPYLEVTIKHASNPGQKEKFSLSTINPKDKTKITVPATNLRGYTEGTDTIAIALVLNGAELWVGNDACEKRNPETDPVPVVGVLDKLEKAIDTMNLAKAGPSGSKAVVISYSNGAEVVSKMDELSKVSGASLGGQCNYFGKTGTNLVAGVEMAFKELKAVGATRKVMVIVGDGSDTDPEKAKVALAEYKKNCKQENIDVFAIIYVNKRPGDEDKPNVVTIIAPTAKTVTQGEGIAAGLADIVTQMADRYYVTFAGFDEKLGVGLPWDGKEHEITVKIADQETEALAVTLAPAWEKATKSGFPWLIVVLASVGGLLLLIILVKVFSSKPAPAPMPMPMPVAAGPAPAEPPKPAGPMKTVMIGAGGSEDGFPVVGWLVPLNGSDAYKTWRLRSGLTKIGTASPADIVINDGFMSTEHCQIQCSPSGFTLLDNGSTNGSYVNDHKVSKHDLVDNDIVMLGKTQLKFKSIV